MQRAAIHLVSRIFQTEILTPILHDLRWLSANFWVKLKALVLIYKVLNGLATWKIPSYPSFVLGSVRDPAQESSLWKCECTDAGQKKEKALRGVLLLVQKLHFLMWNSPWGYAIRTIILLKCLKSVWFPIHDYLMNTLTVLAKIQSLTSWMVKLFWGFLYSLASLREFP